MKNIRRRSTLFLLWVIVVLMLAACGDANNNADADKDGNNNNVENENNNQNEDGNEGNVDEDGEREKVTVKISIPLGDEFFEARFGPAADLLDHIEIEQVGHGGSVEALEEMFAENNAPDIIIGDYPPIEQLGIGYPLDDLVEKYAFDLDRLDQSLLSFMRSLDENGEIAGFPDGNSFYGLYYNKDVFDVLGVDYPDPDVPMTWTELIDLARDMTREAGGTQYYGLQGGYGVALTQQGAARTDPETGEVLIEDDPAFKRYLDLVSSLNSIPGMDSMGENPFAEEQTAAMIIASNNYFQWGWGAPDPSEIEHIDIAPVPVWEDLPDTRPASNAWPMVIPEYSENKEEAFELLMAYLDNEVQIDMAKTMMLQTPLSDPEVLKHYASEVPQYEGKNIQAYFHGDAAEHLETQSQWDQYVNIGEAEERIIEDGLDVNTALRELAEEAEGKIAAAKAAQ